MRKIRRVELMAGIVRRQRRNRVGGLRRFGRVVPEVGGVVVAVEHDTLRVGSEPMREHDVSERAGQRENDEARGHIGPGGAGARGVGDKIAPPHGETETAERRGDERIGTDDVQTSHRVDDDRRHGTAGAQRNNDAAPLVEIPREPRSRSGARAGGEQQKRGKEHAGDRQIRNRGVKGDPRAGAERRSDREAHEHKDTCHR